jgi:spermidine synthase
MGETPRALPTLVQESLRYYGPDVHRAAFALPVFVKNLIEEARA